MGRGGKSSRLVGSNLSFFAGAWWCSILSSSSVSMIGQSVAFCPKVSSSLSSLSHRIGNLRGRRRLYGSSKRSYRQRKSEQQQNDPSTSQLDWGQFEFSSSPKLDKRFTLDIQNEKNFDTLIESEAKEDRLAAEKLTALNEAYQSISPSLVKQATDAIRPFINPNRIHRIESVLKQRTKRSKFLFENPSNPSNVWACLRTIDSFGIQNVDLIIESGKYAGKQAIAQKRGMRTAMGSAQWLSLRNFSNTERAVTQIKKEEGYLLYASDLNPKAVDIRDIDWNAGPICVVMGNEESGISDEMRNMADQTFTLPMKGFAESFNLSVATSIVLAHMSAASKQGPDDVDHNDHGPLRAGDLDDHEINCLRLKGFLNSLPQKRLGQALLRESGVHLPDLFDLL